MLPVNLIFANADIYRNAFKVAWHPILVDLIYWVHSNLLNPLPIITSTYREEDLTSVHGQDPLRGIDLRSRGVDAALIVEEINTVWQYDSRRPDKVCALFHNVGRGPHIHLQVYDSTCIIRDGWGVCATKKEEV